MPLAAGALSRVWPQLILEPVQTAFKGILMAKLHLERWSIKRQNQITQRLSPNLQGLLLPLVHHPQSDSRLTLHAPDVWAHALHGAAETATQLSLLHFLHTLFSTSLATMCHIPDQCHSRRCPDWQHCYQPRCPLGMRNLTPGPRPTVLKSERSCSPTHFNSPRPSAFLLSLCCQLPTLGVFNIHAVS